MRLLIITLSLALLSLSAFAQKFGYVDSEFILGKLPDYQRSQADIEAQAAKWEKEIAGMYAGIDKLQEAYRSEEILLTDQLKAERRKAIDDKRKAVVEYQKKVFGYEGLLYLKKQEIMKPLWDKIFKSIDKIARTKKLDFLFDKASGDLVMLYTNPTHDYTDYVLEDLGIKDAAPTPQPNKRP
jgi:outer membrane protein